MLPCSMLAQALVGRPGLFFHGINSPTASTALSLQHRCSLLEHPRHADSRYTGSRECLCHCHFQKLF